MHFWCNICVLCHIFNILTKFGDYWSYCKEMETDFRNSRWRPPPSWILEIGCHFIIFGPIVTNFGGNVENLTKNANVALKLHIFENSRWQRSPCWISKVGCHFLLLDLSSPNSVGMFRIWHRTQLLHRICIYTEIQDGGISNDCCDFVVIGLICIKFDGNLTTSI